MQATNQSQKLVATFDLQGQGLYPLSDQGKQALVSAVNQTLASKGISAANITLGQVTVWSFLCACLAASVSPLVQGISQCKQEFQNSRVLS